MRLKSLSRISSRDITELTKDSLELISLIGFGPNSRMLVLMRTLDPWRPRRTISWSRRKNLKMRSLQFKSSGFPTKLIWSSVKLNTWLFPETVRNSELKNLFSSKKSSDLTIRFKATKKRSDNLKLLRKISISKWTSSMIFSTKTQIFKKNWRTITSTSKMNSNKNWRN